MITEFSLLMVLASIWAALAVLAFVMSFKVRDITGRIGGSGWGRHIDARWGWFWMELPALVMFPAVYFASGNLHLVGNIAVALWLAHYAHRTLALAPRRTQTGRHDTVRDVDERRHLQRDQRRFCWESYLAFAPQLGDAWLSDPRFILGVVLMLGGAWLNLWSDYRLLALRRQQRAPTRHARWRRIQPELLPEPAWAKSSNGSASPS